MAAHRTQPTVGVDTLDLTPCQIQAQIVNRYVLVLRALLQHLGDLPHRASARMAWLSQLLQVCCSSLPARSALTHDCEVYAGATYTFLVTVMPRLSR